MGLVKDFLRNMVQKTLRLWCCSALARVAANRELQFGLRHLATILLKQFIRKHWDEDEEPFEPPVVQSNEKAALDNLVQRTDIDTSRIIVFGRSLEGAVGAVLARNNPDKMNCFVFFTPFIRIWPFFPTPLVPVLFLEVILGNKVVVISSLDSLQNFRLYVIISVNMISGLGRNRMLQISIVSSNWFVIKIIHQQVTVTRQIACSALPAGLVRVAEALYGLTPKFNSNHVRGFSSLQMDDPPSTLFRFRRTESRLIDD